MNKKFSSRELCQIWDEVATNTLKSRRRPSITDEHFTKVMSGFLDRWVNVEKDFKVLKLDLFNEMAYTPHLEWFSNKGAQTCGIDISKVVTKVAKKNFRGNPLFINGDVRDLPLKDESFDIVFSIGTLEHVKEQETLVAEVKRVLKKDGTAVLGFNNSYSMWLSHIMWEVIDFLGVCRRYGSYEPSYSPKDLRRLLIEAGFVEISLDGTYLLPKFIRLFDLWSEIGTGRFFAWLNKVKLKAYKPLTHSFEELERWGKINYFADSIMAVAKKPM